MPNSQAASWLSKKISTWLPLTALPVSSGRIRDRYDLLTHREEEQTRLLSDSETALRELAADADKAIAALQAAGEQAYLIGSVAAGDAGVEVQL